MLVVILLLLGFVALPAQAVRPRDCADGVARMKRVERSLSVFADYHQFVIADARSALRGLAGGWTDVAIARGHVAGPGYVGVATARAMRVPVTVRVLAGRPPVPGGGWDRVSETALDVSSGEIVVSAVTAARGEGARIRLAPGRYRVRVLAGGLDTISADGLSGSDRYLVELWRQRA